MEKVIISNSSNCNRKEKKRGKADDVSEYVIGVLERADKLPAEKTRQPMERYTRPNASRTFRYAIQYMIDAGFDLGKNRWSSNK